MTNDWPSTLPPKHISRCLKGKTKLPELEFNLSIDGARHVISHARVGRIRGQTG